MADDKKEGVAETNTVVPSRDVLIERNALLIDVITMMKNWEYMPSDRITRWRAKLESEDMIFLKDLMGANMSSLDNDKNRFPFKLYDTLRFIKTSVTQIRVQVITPPTDLKGSIPFRNLEGYYIDSGYLHNGRKAFVKVGSNGLAENRYCQIIYLMKNGRWAFHHIEGADKQWAWMQCKQNGTEDKISSALDWLYWNNESKCNDPIKLQINSLHR